MKISQPSVGVRGIAYIQVFLSSLPISRLRRCLRSHQPHVMFCHYYPEHLQYTIPAYPSFPILAGFVWSGGSSLSLRLTVHFSTGCRPFKAPQNYKSWCQWSCQGYGETELCWHPVVEKGNYSSWTTYRPLCETSNSVVYYSSIIWCCCLISVELSSIHVIWVSWGSRLESDWLHKLISLFIHI